MPRINEEVLWKSAVKLRGSVQPSEYMQVVLGLIFLKYISDRFERQKEKILKTEKINADKKIENKDYYECDNIFYVPKKARWNYIAQNSKNPEIGQIIDQAFIEFEESREEGTFKDILPKNYSDSDLGAKDLGELIDLFTNQLEIEENEGDFIGQIYEYFMGKFSRTLGQKGGEFYTPKCVVELLVKMLNPQKGRVYDPCCGSGGMFVQTAAFLKDHQANIDDVSIYGQEKQAQTWRLAKMNLAIRNIRPNLGNHPADTFTEDLFPNTKFEYIIANPPFNLDEYGQESLAEDKRWYFGVPPKKNANYAWIQHMYSKLNINGIAGFVLANGSLSTMTKEESAIRKSMLENGVVDCIVSLPEKLFYTTGIPVSLWFLRKDKNDKKVLFIDAREMGKMIDRKVKELTTDDINKISQVYLNWKSDPQSYEDVVGFCKVADLNEIEENEYSLVPGRYVGISKENELSKEEIKEQLKILSSDLLKLFDEAEELENKVKEILKNEIK